MFSQSVDGQTGWKSIGAQIRYRMIGKLKERNLGFVTRVIDPVDIDLRRMNMTEKFAQKNVKTQRKNLKNMICKKENCCGKCVSFTHLFTRILHSGRRVVLCIGEKVLKMRHLRLANIKADDVKLRDGRKGGDCGLRARVWRGSDGRGQKRNNRKFEESRESKFFDRRDAKIVCEKK
jgi:hypothetical protein